MTIQDALNLHRAGRLDEAEAVYRHLLAAQPSHSLALHYYGVLRAQRGDMAGSADLLRRALVQTPDDALAHFHLAEALRALGHFAEAADHFSQAVHGRPDFAEAYSGLAEMRVEAKAWEDGLQAADKALALKPDLIAAVIARGLCLTELGRHEEALSAFDYAIVLQPEAAEAFLNRGCVLFKLGKMTEALAAFDHAVACDPGAMLGHTNRASVLMELGRSEEALTAFQQGLAADPIAAVAYYNFGSALLALGRYEAAVAAFDSALTLKPDYGEAAYNKAKALLELGRKGEYLTALELASALGPDLGLPASRLFLERALHCEWQQRDEELAHLLQLCRDGQLVDVAVVMGAVDDPALHLKAANLSAGPAREPLYRARTGRQARLRIGYLSPDFRDHPVGHQIVEVLEHHDPARFTVIGLSSQRGESSPIRDRLIAAFAEFHELEGLSDRALAEQIAALDLDILIDIGGYTQMSRLTALAAKPAPVIVEYLGYPGTTGAAYIDYVVADAVCLPPEQEAFFSEKIVRLPGCFFPADSKDRPVVPTRTRRDEGLPEDAFVFCSFNSTHKITPALFSLWMRLLQAVPKSVLWLAAATPLARANLQREAVARGVPSDRLIFAERVDRAIHLGRIGLADLFLDSTPYNAHATCSDALWAGLPVLTCTGKSMASRIAGSMLTAVGAGALIVSDMTAYEVLALELARSPARLKGLRGKIAAGKAALFDTERLTRSLEAAYEIIVDRSEKGQNPANFSVMLPV